MLGTTGLCKKGTVLLSTSLAWPALAGCTQAETFSQLSAISFAQPCISFQYLRSYRPCVGNRTSVAQKKCWVLRIERFFSLMHDKLISCKHRTDHFQKGNLFCTPLCCSVRCWAHLRGWVKVITHFPFIECECDDLPQSKQTYPNFWNR